MKNPLKILFSRPKSISTDEEADIKPKKVTSISPGRVSEPDDPHSSFLLNLKCLTHVVTPSFRVEVIQLIRDLYKINPDVSIALQDMFKLANTSHYVLFPNNSEAEADKMIAHLKTVSKKWSNYTAGIDGLVNKMMVQLMVSGAISIEGVPNKDLTGLSTILFIRPDSIVFKRENDGVYIPYQKVRYGTRTTDQIKLNTETYVYAGMFNDVDEPYGIPPFMAALDSIQGQHDMRVNFKHIMENQGMLGFLEAKMAKPEQKSNESLPAYEARLLRTLKQLKANLKDGMKDGLVTGYIDDHEFNMNSTTKDMANINIPWNMNQQSVANGLSVNGSLIGVNGSNTDTGTSIMLSKMISQLKNLQMIVSFALEFIYSLELRLAGFNNKGMSIKWPTSTVADEVKVQQARQYKIQNNDLLYRAGIISQEQYARDVGYDSPDQDEPRAPLDGTETQDPQEMTKKKQRQADKNQSARRTRDKNNPNPSRGDQNTKTR